VIVDGEDYTKVTDTYPKHPLSKVSPKHETVSNMIEQRRNLEKGDIRSKKAFNDARVAKAKSLNFKDYY
jgi:hypothetical protein